MNRVIGVMGGSGVAASLPESVGRQLAANQCVVLTGGRHDEDIHTVKSLALMAAREHKLFVGALGILKEPGHLDTSFDCTPYVYTGAGHLRNALNGIASDALIALPGDRGTLSEVYFADLAHRRIVFLGWDRQELADKIHRHARRLGALIDQAAEAGYHDERPAIARLLDLAANRGFVASTSEEAVATVTNREVEPLAGRDVLAALSSGGRLDRGVGVRQQFERAFQILSDSSCGA